MMKKVILTNWKTYFNKHGGLNWETIDEDISFESFHWPDNDPLRLYHQDF